MDIEIGQVVIEPSFLRGLALPWYVWLVIFLSAMSIILGCVLISLRRQLYIVQSRFISESSARSQAERELVNREQRLQTIFDSQLECVKLYDASGTILTMNQVGIARLGEYCAGPVLGSSVYGFIAPEHREQYRALTEAVFKGESGSMEMRLTCPEGHPRLMDTHIVPMKDTQGVIVAALAVTRDITERRDAEERAQRHLSDLARVARASSMGEMASGLAHEINQPLAAMVNHANACIRYLKITQGVHPRVRESLEEINIQGQRAAQIIRNVRDLFARGEPQRCLVDINEAAQSIMRIATPEATRQGVNIQLSLDPFIKPVLATRIEVEQVLYNILRNALEAVGTSNDGTKSIIKLNTRCILNAVELTVSDNGPGISEVDLNRIFEPFFTTKVDGIGMGLSISRSLVEAHGGHLSIQSNTQYGVTVQVVLPCG